MRALAKEKSPYLQQHASNPVDWFAWGEEAFRKAKKENKPILLSIGYSTCHWCHVMEEESFTDEATAKIMNDGFVSIKVDREERPDIDSVYMSFVTATTGSGGWPMTVFLTPDRKPFYGGTYFPPEDRYGMPGFKTLLNEIAHAWTSRHDEIMKSADSSEAFLNTQELKNSASAAELTVKIFEEYFESCDAAFDAQYGGFGRAPKFPRSHALSLLLRCYKRSGNVRALEIAQTTLDAMVSSGTRDLLEGGFHRYSTDVQWRVPHFEKMLYDQALLARTYTEAYQLTGQKRYAETAKDTLDYVLFRMTDAEGGFYCAEDADSADMQDQGKKKEGAFYLWSLSEIESALGEKDAPIFAYRYGIKAQGNALSDPHGEFGGKNVLYEKHDLKECEEHFSIKTEDLVQLFEVCRQKLIRIREQRPKPFLDDKVLTDWNALMIDAFCYGWQVYGDVRYRKAALKASVFIKNKMRDEKGKLLHRWRQNSAGIDGSISDYSFLIFSNLSVYESTFDRIWIDEAKNLADEMIRLFWDEKSGGFYLTSSESERLIARPKEIYDGAVPSGNSVAALALERLSRFLEDEKYAQYSRRTLEVFSASLSASPMSYPQFLMALDAVLGPSLEILISPGRDVLWLEAILKEIHLRFNPNKIIMLQSQSGKDAPSDAKVFICRDKVCSLPISSVEDLKHKLES